MKLLIRLIFFTIVLAIVVPAAIVVLSIEKRPAVGPMAKLSLADVRRAQALIKYYDPKNIPSDRVTVIRTNQAEINTVLNASLSPLRIVRGKAHVTYSGTEIAVTVALPAPDNPLGRYVNIVGVVAPSREGLKISRLSLGRINIPPAIVLPTLRFTLDILVGPGKGAPIMRSIRSVRINGSQVAINYQPPPKLVEDLQQATLRHAAVSSPGRVRIYYRQIARTAERLPRRGHVSLTRFIGPVFALAKERSVKEDPVEENRAAVLALALYFGDYRFERFIGTVTDQAMRDRRGNIEHVRLRGRHDFVQHFTISAGLSLTGGRDVADLIGEIKEVKDSGTRSGFSFTDLAADKAGVRFAELAVLNRDSARRFQRLLSAGPGEDLMFPRTDDLPEKLSAARFQAQYGGTDGAAYKRLVAMIDRRIDAIPLFR